MRPGSPAPCRRPQGRWPIRNWRGASWGTLSWTISSPRASGNGASSRTRSRIGNSKGILRSSKERMTTYKFSFPTLIHFGAGVRHQAGEFLQARGFHRPLVVTDKGLAALPLTADFKASLERLGMEPAVFAGVEGNPVESQVSAGVEAFRAHQGDCLVGFGGGAALDVCKAVALMSKHPGSIFDYEDEKPGARPMLEKDLPFWVALPTTAGTGSEVGRSAVIADSKHVKRIIFGPCLLARAVFADPELTLGLPP